MSTNYRFRRHTMDTLIGGISPLDLTTISMESVNDAEDFLLSYGFDWNDEADRKELFGFYQKAIVFVQSEICREGEVIGFQRLDCRKARRARQHLAGSHTASLTLCA